MELPRVEMNPVIETVKQTFHFLLRGQFNGFSGSSDQAGYFDSGSEEGSFASRSSLGKVWVSKEVV